VFKFSILLRFSLKWGFSAPSFAFWTKIILPTVTMPLFTAYPDKPVMWCDIWWWWCWVHADTLDVCTMTGEVIGLHRLAKSEYVAPYVSNRETYVPVIVDARRQQGLCAINKFIKNTILHLSYCWRVSEATGDFSRNVNSSTCGQFTPTTQLNSTIVTGRQCSDVIDIVTSRCCSQTTRG